MDNELLLAILSQIEEALYESKTLGKNQVSVFKK